MVTGAEDGELADIEVRKWAKMVKAGRIPTKF